MKKTSPQKNKSILTMDIPLDKGALVASVLLAGALVTGLYIKERVINESAAFQTVHAYYLLILFGLFATCISYFVIRFIYKKADEASAGKGSLWGPSAFLTKLFCLGQSSGSFFALYKKRGFAIAVMLLVMWIPWFIIRFPGCFSYDTIVQLGQYYGINEATDFHPYLDTLIFGAFWDFGLLFNSWQVSLASYAIVQSVATAMSLSAVVCYLLRERVSPKIALIIILFLGLFPAFPLFAQTMVKDCLNGWLILVFILMAVEAFRSKGRLLKRWPMVLLFVVVALFTCLTKKTGAYIVVPTLVILFVYVRGCRKYAATVLVAVVALCACWSLVALPAMNVKSGQVREALSLPIQQTARYVYLHEGELTEGDFDVLNGVFEIESLDSFSFSYNPTSVDETKKLFRDGCSNESKIAWAGWLCSSFLKDPLSFVEAPLGIAWKYFYPYVSSSDSQDSMVPFDALVWHDGVLGSLPSDVEQAEAVVASTSAETQTMLKPLVEITNFEMRSGGADSISYESSFIYLNFAQVPYLLFSMALYSFWIPVVLVCYFVRTRNWRTVLGTIPVVLIFCSLLVGPTAIARYIIPLLYALPLYAGLAFCASGENQPQGIDTLTEDVS